MAQQPARPIFPPSLPSCRLTSSRIKLLDVLMRRDLIASRELFPPLVAHFPVPRRAFWGI